MYKFCDLKCEIYEPDKGEFIYDFCNELSEIGKCKIAIGRFNDIYIICDNHQSADMLIDNYNKALYRMDGLNCFICEFHYNGEIKISFKYGRDKWEVIANLQRDHSEYKDFSIISVHNY